MRGRIIAFVAVVVATCVAFTAYADFGQYAEDLRAKERTADPEHLVQAPIQNVLKANCNINDALRAGLAGDSKSFSEALRDAENNLQLVADKLAPIAKERRFMRVILEKPRQFPLPDGTAIQIRTGDDILNAIAALAKRSADAIDRIRIGKGSDDDLAEIARNSGVISQLILQFYGIGIR
jgi:hypothetical protein